MQYDFSALESSGDGEEQGSVGEPGSEQPDDGKEKEIARLQVIREEKKKYLINLAKNVMPGEDEEHSVKVKELSKQTVKLSKDIQLHQQQANELEKKLAEISAKAGNIAPKPIEPPTDDIREMRIETDILKVEIQKAKRALALEGGCLNRARQIKKLQQMIAETPQPDTDNQSQQSDSEKSSTTKSVDLVELKNEVHSLKAQHQNLKLKLSGIQSRISVLEKADLREKVHSSYSQSKQDDALINSLIQRPVSPKKPSYKGHISQQSRQLTIIKGLYSELMERQEELNHYRVENGEAGIVQETERLQRRLHLLESSLSCLN